MIFSDAESIFRWLHVLCGIVWIGMLYYFNFVQTEFFKETEASVKQNVLIQLVPRALWWFRWGAAFTLLTGLVLLLMKWPGWSLYIYFGSLLGILMAINVWFVIWPNQKIVIENAFNEHQGRPGIDGAADALMRAGCASRHNTLFSVPMLLFMIASAHGGGDGAYNFLDTGSASLIGTALILLLEYNALRGTVARVFITSVPQVIGAGFVLTLILGWVAELLS